MYYVYILRTENDTLYTGITNDLYARMHKHVFGVKSAAKYTRSHPPKSLEAVWSCSDRSHALRLEYQIKTLRRQNKERLIAAPRLFSAFFPTLEKEDFIHHPKATLPLFLKTVTLSDLP